jgi:hypothetical protein
MTLHPGACLATEEASASNADRRRGQHAKQIARKSLARVPVLEPDDVLVGRVELA